MNGKLIVIEGLDGSGKSTQTALIKEKIEKTGLKIRQIKLPDYESESSALVRMYLGGEFGSDPSDVNTFATSLFYTVDRFANYTKVWKEDYLKGTVILADRYTTSNAVHQMVKLPKDKWDEYLLWLEDIEYTKVAIPKPDLVFFLDMPVDVSQRLMTERYSGDENKKDVHEANVEYLNACHESALYAADKLGWIVIKCADGENPRKIDDINNDIFKEIKNFAGI
ncbi:MAG: thymidylate kinase [Ruminococcaceae bacterium]|jgi:dTMP kinase|nr:thymidylate kinase [Oscillospiraceae bacterium]